MYVYMVLQYTLEPLLIEDYVCTVCRKNLHFMDRFNGSKYKISYLDYIHFELSNRGQYYSVL